MFKKKLSEKDLKNKVKELETSLKNCQSHTVGDGSTYKLDKKVKELEQIIEERTGGKDEKEIFLKMNSALAQAKEKLQEQQQMLEELTQEPLPFATVLKVYKQKEATGDQLFKEAKKSAFKVGATVKIARESLYADQNSNEGTILVVEDGIDHPISVRFTDKYKNSYRYTDLLLKDEMLTKKKSKNSTALVYFEGKLLEVILPKKLFASIKPGDSVKLSGQTMQIVDKAERHIQGEIGIVTEDVNAMSCEVDVNGTKLVVFKGKHKEKIVKGDRVVLDMQKSIVMKNMGKNEKKYTLTSDVNVSWEDIGGLEEAKKQMREAIEAPHKMQEHYAFYRKKPMKGILLYGPPGCGKTLLAKAATTALANIYDAKDAEAMGSGYIYIKGPEILTKWVGESEAIIRQLFIRAREHKAKHGFPAIIFIDEAEAIFRKRGSGISSDIENTIVPMFLAEMDGLDDTGALIILATNRPDILDPAVVRDGRIDRKIRVSRPTAESAKDIFRIHLKDIPLYNGYSREELAEYAAENVFCDKHSFYEVHEEKDKHFFTLSHILNGGMIAGIVDQATSFAMRRDEEQSGDLTGLSKDDIEKAVTFVHQQNIDLDHEEAIKEFVEAKQLTPVKITKCTTTLN